MDKGVELLFQLSDTAFMAASTKIKGWEDLALSGKELEARIKRVSPVEARKILEERSPWNESQFKERRYKSSGSASGVIRERTGESETVVVNKSTIRKVKDYDGWVTWVLSTEHGARASTLDSKSTTETYKRRWSQTVDGIMIVDVTHNIEEDIWAVEVEVLDTSEREKIVKYVKELVLAMKGPIRRTTSEIVFKLFSEPRGNFSFTERKYQKPVTITNKDLRLLDKEKYLMTPKIDGERRFVCSLNGNVYTIDLRGTVRHFSSGPCKEGQYGKFDIFDSELAGGKLYIFDSITAEATPGVDVVTKPFIRVPKDWTLIPKKFEEWKREYKVDGIIFCPENNPKGRIFKWKEDNTIDLEVSQGRLVTSDGVDLGESEIEEDGVYEFSYVRGNFVMIRSRRDKPRPNSSAIVYRNIGHMKTFEDCPVTKWTRSGKGMLSMRRFHNRVKRMMYDRASWSGAIMDVGTGQGGDTRKWKKYSFVYCIEPEEDMAKELRRRLRQSANTLSLIIRNKMRDGESICEYIVNRISTVSLFFVMNSFEEEDMIGLLETIDSRCHRNCVVMGSFLDGDLLKEESNDDFVIGTRPDDKYFIEIKGTRIKQLENKFTINTWNFADEMRSRGFRLSPLKRLDFWKDAGVKMSKTERILSSMFVAFEFRRM
jgi:ribosomal protein S10